MSTTTLHDAAAQVSAGRIPPSVSTYTKVPFGDAGTVNVVVRPGTSTNTLVVTTTDPVPYTVDPSWPVVPVGPVAPVGPIGPCGPVAPVAPVAPVGPIGPCAPVGPTAPCGPVAPVAPVAPVGPIG